MPNTGPSLPQFKLSDIITLRGTIAAVGLVLVAMLAIGAFTLPGVSAGGTASIAIDPIDYRTVEPADHMNANDPGRGQCVKGDKILKDLREEKPDGLDMLPDGYDYKDKEEMYVEDDTVAWLTQNSHEPCVVAMAKSYGTDNGAKLAAKLKKHAVIRTVGEATHGKGLVQLNTYFLSDGTVVEWKNKDYDLDVLMWFELDDQGNIKHDENGVPIALFQVICGNPQERPRTVAEAKQAAIKASESSSASPTSASTSTTSTTATSAQVVPTAPTSLTTSTSSTTSTTTETTVPAGTTTETTVPTEPTTSTTTTTTAPLAAKPDNTLPCMLDGEPAEANLDGSCPPNHVVQSPQNGNSVNVVARPAPITPAGQSVVHDPPNQGAVVDADASNTNSSALDHPLQ